MKRLAGRSFKTRARARARWWLTSTGATVNALRVRIVGRWRQEGPVVRWALRCDGAMSRWSHGDQTTLQQQHRRIGSHRPIALCRASPLIVEPSFRFKDPPPARALTLLLSRPAPHRPIVYPLGTGLLRTPPPSSHLAPFSLAPAPDQHSRRASAVHPLPCCRCCTSLAWAQRATGLGVCPPRLDRSPSTDGLALVHLRPSILRPHHALLPAFPPLPSLPLLLLPLPLHQEQIGALQEQVITEPRIV